MTMAQMEKHGRDSREVAGTRRYARYAAAFLAVTVLAGVWLRAGLLRPGTLAGLSFRNLVHAHSHLAFFGWVTMALFALVLRESGREGAGWPWPRWHAHLLAAASVAVFLGFLWTGYAPLTIALSAVHVVLWVAFARRAWPTRGTGGAGDAFLRVALAFLLLAGAGTIGTGILSSRAADPWTSRLAIELFLTPFTAGWLVLGAFGAAYARLSHPRFAGVVLVLGAAGALPSGLLHIAAPPPAPWLLLVGRAGMLLVAVASVAFALDVLRERGASPFLRLAGAAALVKGTAELAVGLGFAGHLLGSHPLVIGYLHLVLLGMVTPILVDALLAPARVVVQAALHAAGLVLQLGALGALGWAPLLHLSTWLGLGAGGLLTLALVGGVLSAAALVAASARVIAQRAAGTPVVARRSDAGGPGVRAVVAAGIDP